jgi:hypothetical protein
MKLNDENDSELVINDNEVINKEWQFDNKKY